MHDFQPIVRKMNWKVLSNEIKYFWCQKARTPQPPPLVHLVLEFIGSMKWRFFAGRLVCQSVYLDCELPIISVVSEQCLLQGDTEIIFIFHTLLEYSAVENNFLDDTFRIATKDVNKLDIEKSFITVQSHRSFFYSNAWWVERSQT